jgi:GGDEF domain-containing protein
MGIENPNFKNTSSPEDQLGDFFDKDKAHLREKLDSEEYQKMRQEFIDEGLDAENLNNDLEDANYRARYDEVTGLRRRGELYRQAGDALKEIFGIEKGKHLSQADFLDRIREHKDDPRLDELHLMMSDVSFLSVANRGSHDDGDRLLKDISRAMSGDLGICSRHGGDEISALLHGQPDQIRQLLAKAKAKVGALEGVANLKAFNLKPNVDLATASLAEAIDLAEKLEAAGIERRSEKQDASSDLLDTWVSLADKKAGLEKAKERLELLIERRRNGEVILNDLRKSVYDIEDPEIDRLLAEIAGGQDQERLIRDFIKINEYDSLEKEDSDYKRARGKIILDSLI